MRVKQSEPFVVKAQISRFTSDGKTRVLIYDNDRTVTYENDANEHVARRVGARSFWWATLGSDGIVYLQTKSNEDEFDKYNYGVMNP